METLQGFKGKEHIIEEYTPLVKYIASRVSLGKNKYMDYDDLVSYGLIGLMDAITKYDESKGIKFSSYASIRIKGAIIDEIRRARPISKGAMDKLNKYNKAVEILQNKLFREPTNEEIAQQLNVTVADVAEIENYINYISIVSLDDIIFSDDDDMNVMGVIEDKQSPSPEQTFENKEKISNLSDAISKLKEKDRIVLNLYYYERLTLKEIGKVLEVSESRVCQLHSRAIRNLREKMKELNYI
ncbi:FliA/WhiG family RNA polymerase sigma factor [Clostridium sp. HCP1S3_B4]|uniref:FliA/WhiG family RNA polymerase sigma factor n=1 Tax=unclassified Clostridium TaxID=2614128 RepID=UPI002A7B427F|nr:FliA/WhiG family RNA polymerase sigma factor [Clostridiales bacterium]MDY2729255.1 FliA/WhiG family RNA polymerase sigma factor [Clostridium sp.]